MIHKRYISFIFFGIIVAFVGVFSGLGAASEAHMQPSEEPIKTSSRPVPTVDPQPTAPIPVAPILSEQPPMITEPLVETPTPAGTWEQMGVALRVSLAQIPHGAESVRPAPPLALQDTGRAEVSVVREEAVAAEPTVVDEELVIVAPTAVPEAAPVEPTVVVPATVIPVPAVVQPTVGAPTQPSFVQRGEAALGRIPFQLSSIGYTISFHAGSSTYRGLTFTRRRHIEIYVRQSMSDAQLTYVIGHEIGHAVDHIRNDLSDRSRWRAARGMAPNLGWWPTGIGSDLATPAGDFAECFASWAIGSPSHSSWGSCAGAAGLMSELVNG